MQVIRDLWNRFFFTGEMPEQLGLLRIWIGLGLLPFHALQFKFVFKLDPDGLTFHFLDPIWYFNVLGVHAVDVQTAIVIFCVLMIATVGFALGLFTRTSLVIVLVSILFLKGVRDSTAGDVHHRYLIPFNILLLFLFSRCHQVYSIDAWWKRKRSIRLLPLAEWEASWPIKAAQLYVCSFYLWSAIAKLRMTGFEWASMERLRDLLLSRAVRNGFEDGGPSAGSDLAYWIANNEFLTGALAQSTYLFEFGFPLILLIRDVRIRLVFFSGITLFHVANYYVINVQFLFLPVVFAIFFDISQPLRKIGLIHGVERAESTATHRNHARALAVYWSILWIAVLFRIDRFPLSWAPMYSVWAPSTRDVYSVKHIEKSWLEDYGWRATHRDGTQSWVNRRDLNVRKSSMRRMYYRRTRGKGPPKEGHYNHDAGTFDRWLWGLAPGEPYYEINWHRRLFESINKTYGYHPADLRFIVRLEAKGEKLMFRRDTLEFLGTTDYSVEARWNEAWIVDF